jgi:chromosome segregation ATPase
VNVDHQESLEAEVKRLREQLDAALDREAGTSDAYEDAAASASGYRADRDRLRRERDFHEEAYKQEHRTRHAMEDEIARLRERVAELEAALTCVQLVLGTRRLLRDALADDGGGA